MRQNGFCDSHKESSEKGFSTAEFPRYCPARMELSDQRLELAAVHLAETYDGFPDDHVKCLTHFVEITELFNRYRGWCKERKLEVISPNELAAVGKILFPSLKIMRRGDGLTGWCNVRRKS